MQAFCHPLHSSKLACSSLKPYKPIDLRPRFSRTVRCYSQMDGRGVPSTTLLDSLKADKEFAQHLTAQQSFDTVLDMHMTLHDLVNQAVPLKLAPTQVSNDQGVLLHRSTGAGPLKQGTLRVQTLLGPAPIEWVHHTFGIAPGFAYSKSSVYTQDDSFLPHLELEMGTGGDGSKLLLYINMDPRLSLVTNPQYLEHFYESAPPGSSSSWMQVEAKAAQSPGFTRFTSPSFHVRACSATSILFNVEASAEGVSAAKNILQEATECWLGWLKAHGKDCVCSNHAAVEQLLGSEAAAEAKKDPSKLQQELASRSRAWRRFPRREKQAGMMIASFGEQTMEEYWNSMAGEGVRKDT